jgi:hypothetical protein
LAETAILDYRLFFANQGKQTSLFHFRLQQTKVFHFHFLFATNKWNLPFSVTSVFSVCGNLETLRHKDMEMEKRRWRHGNKITLLITVYRLVNPSPHSPFYLLHLTTKGFLWP